MSTAPTQVRSPVHPAPEPLDTYAEALACAKLTALKALLEIVNTTDDEKERRQAATTILRTPDPKEPLASARRTPTAAHTNTQAAPPAPSPTPQPHPAPPHRKPWTVEQALAYAERFLAEYDAQPAKATTAKLPKAHSPAATLAATAVAAPHEPRGHSP